MGLAIVTSARSVHAARRMQVEVVIVALCAVQGMELVNPVQSKDEDLRSGTESYFSEYSGFRSIKKVPGL